MINKTFQYSLLFLMLALFNTSFAIAAGDDAKIDNTDAHADHKHEHHKIDKNDPKYKEYLKQQIKKDEEFKKEVKDFENSEKFNKDLLSQNLKYDVNVGDPNAPITVVEYASLSCGHCKNFHETVYYPLKKEYIDTGKVYFKYRHYPLNGSAVKGAMIVSCADDESKTAILGGLFKGQSQWAYAKNESQLIDRLQTASMIAGLDKDEFKNCYENEAMQDEILAAMKQANKELNVESTPTVFVNGSRYLQARDYETFKNHLESILLDK